MGPVDMESVAMNPTSPMSSPGREAPPWIDSFSAKTCSAKWFEDFEIIPRESGSTLTCGIQFHNPDKKQYDLSRVDTLAGNKLCKENTEKQWDTIIKGARADDKLPDAIKAAQFHYLNTVASGNDLGQKPAEGLQVPLEKYARGRYEDLRKEYKRVIEGEDRKPRKFYYEQLRYQRSPNIQRSVSKFKSSVSQLSPKTHFSVERRFHFRLEYMNTADQYKQTSELRSTLNSLSNGQRGSPSLLLVWSGEKEVQKLKIFEALENLISTTTDRFDPETISFKWYGDIDQSLNLYQGKTILSVSFENIVSIRYSLAMKYLLVSYRTEKTSEQSEILLKLSPIDDYESWMTLQTCCYKLCKNSKTKECKREPEEIFTEKFRAFEKLQKKEVVESLPEARLKRVPECPWSGSHRRARSALEETYLLPPSPKRASVPSAITANARAEKVVLRHSLALARPLVPSKFGQDRILEWEAKEREKAEAQEKELEEDTLEDSDV